MLALSCQKPLRNLNEMQAYLADPDNGLIKVQQDSLLKATAYLVPTALQARQSPEDSAAYVANGGLTIVLKLEAVQQGTEDFLIGASNSYGQYAQIVEDLSFNPGKYLALQLPDGSEVVPVLSTLETAFEHNPAKRLYVVFPGTLENGGALKDKEKVKLVFRNLFENQPEYQFEFDLDDLAQFERLSHV